MEGRAHPQIGYAEEAAAVEANQEIETIGRARSARSVLTQHLQADLRRPASAVLAPNRTIFS
jgi:hypothetical protein